MAGEETFDLQIPEAEAEKIATVHDVVDYIEKNAKSVKQ
jgi:acyl carrier protein